MKVEMDFYKNLISLVRNPAILKYVRVYIVLYCTMSTYAEPYHENVQLTVLILTLKVIL
jgi:hypothetical protein